MPSNRFKNKFAAASRRRKKIMMVRIVQSVRDRLSNMTINPPRYIELSAGSMSYVNDMRNKALDLCNIPQLTEITLDFKAASSTISLNNSVEN